MDGLRYWQAAEPAWLVLTRGTRTAMLPAESSQERVDEVWAALQDGSSLDEVFEAVTGGLAGSLSKLPSFGLLSVDGQVHVLLRGPLDLLVDGAAVTSGKNLRTWSEQVLPASGRLTVRATGEPAAAAGPVLVLREGMAPANSVELELGALPAAAAPPGAGQAVPESRPAAPAPAAPAPAVVAHEPAQMSPVPPAPAPAFVPPPAAAVPPEVRAPAEPGPAPSSGPDLSDAVPWLKLTPPPLSPDAGADAGAEDPATEVTGDFPALEDGEPTETLPPVPEDHDGDTVMGFSPQPGTALPGTPASAASGTGDLDDDGETIRSAPAAPQGPGAAPGNRQSTDTGPTVLARTCPQGHVNPPTAAACRTCGSEISGEPHPVQRPSLGILRLSTGQTYELDRNIIIGRQPSASRVAGAALPRMVQVPSDSGDISRSHAEVRLEGWHVMLKDLFSTNGTVLIREGALPRRLAQGEAAILLDGDIAELGDGVTLRFEGLA